MWKRLWRGAGMLWREELNCYYTCYDVWFEDVCADKTTGGAAEDVNIFVQNDQD